MIYAYHKFDELYHHGILGQKWGKRNGPPYPLDAEDHSKAEIDANNSTANTKNTNTATKIKFHLSDAQKKYIKIGAAAVATTIAIAGGIYLAKQGKLDDIVLSGKQITDSLIVDIQNPTHIPDVVKNKFGVLPDGMSVSDKLSTAGDLFGRHDCVSGNLAAMERINHNLNIKAKTRLFKGIRLEEVEQIYPGSKFKTVMPVDNSKELGDYIRSTYTAGASGLIGLHGKHYNHGIGFEVNYLGKTIFRDQQFKLKINGKMLRGIEFSADGSTMKIGGIDITDTNKINSLINWYFLDYNLDLTEVARLDNIDMTSNLNLLSKYFR